MLEISVDDIIEEVNYSKEYFKKILYKNKISNKFMLNKKDLKILQKLPIKNEKSMNLRIYVNKILNIENFA